MPLSIRAKGTSIAASANWMNNFIIAFVVPPMLDKISWGTYIFFAVWSALGGIFIFFCVPETKGKTLEEMDQVFGSHTSNEDLEEFAKVQARVGLTALIQGSRGRGMVERVGAASDESSLDKETDVKVEHVV
jgi:Na+/melibiose symporter-like transporter